VVTRTVPGERHCGQTYRFFLVVVVAVIRYRQPHADRAVRKTARVIFALVKRPRRFFSDGRFVATFARTRPTAIGHDGTIVSRVVCFAYADRADHE